MPSSATLKKINAVSGLGFAVFVLLHFLSHYALNLSYEQATETMLAMRIIYQNPVFEVLLLCCLLAHMYSNAGLYMARSKLASTKKDDDAAKKKKQPLPGLTELNAHRYAGYALAVFIFGHVFAVRIAPLLFLPEDPGAYDYSFVAKVYELVPFYIFPIYLSIFGMVGGWHTIYGVRSAIATLSGKSVVGKPFPLPLKIVALLSHALVIGALISLEGYRTTVDMSEKAELHDKLNAAMGIH
uniref:Mitochondrial adapter protein MCP1 transmembrane domain-containing protein n=1 Tax=Cyclophora tenuis TaxID=216820 RepID=A0A7S1D1Q7_CYCTE|mmetsp:Transcript_16280/g.27572  ORF Transcript_16280/g.27572 Transcript_16280/m.27572 type:complete len:241 (+) Transcript_16280:92-814(+)